MNTLYSRPEIIVISIEPDENLMNPGDSETGGQTPEIGTSSGTLY